MGRLLYFHQMSPMDDDANRATKWLNEGSEAHTKLSNLLLKKSMIRDLKQIGVSIFTLLSLYTTSLFYIISDYVTTIFKLNLIKTFVRIVNIIELITRE